MIAEIKFLNWSVLIWFFLKTPVGYSQKKLGGVRGPFLKLVPYSVDIYKPRITCIVSGT